jgi:two-component system sensor histidine kinase QseC
VVNIDSATAESEVIIRISDNGPGIPAEEREHVFELFVSSRAGGLGLGLAVVKEIIQMHQGSVIVEDSPLGGAQFCIRLPRYRNRKQLL